MPGNRFTFSLRNKTSFNKATYVAALMQAVKVKAPPELYVSFDGREAMGVGLVIKVQRHPEWTLILPLDPLVNAIGCELTIGVVSRKAIWDWIRTTLVLVCRAAPFAFVFSYEDHDVGEAGVVEVGFYDYKADAFLVQHRGLPGAEEMEKRAREQRRV
ncbi:MAG: hypothetical protein WDW36_003490 [Sanguina aurantia]